jgi:hypothetical protein
MRRVVKVDAAKFPGKRSPESDETTHDVAAAVLAAAEETGARVLSGDVGGLQATLAAYLAPEHVKHRSAPVRRRLNPWWAVS